MFPDRIKNIFQNNGDYIGINGFQITPQDRSRNGIYALNFYTLGVPHTVIIDDYMPN